MRVPVKEAEIIVLGSHVEDQREEAKQENCRDQASHEPDRSNELHYNLLAGKKYLLPYLQRKCIRAQSARNKVHNQVERELLQRAKGR
jgi:hypothetical protein